MSKIRVILADDHTIARMGISALLKYRQDIEVVGEAEDGEGAIKLAKELKPDVVISDLVMPEMDGAETTRRLREALPGIKVIILTTFGSSADISRAIANGASGAVTKDVTTEELADAIHAACRGETAFSPEIAKSMKEEPVLPEFTKRQQDILHSVTRGLTNEEIALQFGISVSGVKHHCLTIFKKLGAANRSEAVAIAMRRQLLKV